MPLDQNTVIQKAKAIKLLLTDIDGILNDGHLYYGETGEVLKVFHVRDGLAIQQLLPRHGITVGIITGRSSAALSKRMADLNVTCLYQGVKDKLPIYKEILQKYFLQGFEVAYLGDDLPDLPVMAEVGLSVTVPDAPSYIRERADLCTKTPGGHGALREVADMILEAQGKSVITLF